MTESENSEQMYCWYYSMVGEKFQKDNKYYQAHKILSTKIGETPGGTDSEVHLTQCGLECEMWGTVSFSPEMGTLQDILRVKVPLCPVCHQVDYNG